jgi:hypothetical protein
MIRIALLVLAVAACGKKDDKPAGDKPSETTTAKPGADTTGPCPPLAVLVDGKPLEGITHGQGVIMENSGYRTPMIQLYNHDKSTCEEILTGRRTPQENEINVRAWHGQMPGVGIDAFTQIEGTLTLDKPTEKVGETMQICVRAPVVFTPNAGAYSGKKVSIVGTFAAPFCGVNKS